MAALARVHVKNPDKGIFCFSPRVMAPQCQLGINLAFSLAISFFSRIFVCKGPSSGLSTIIEVAAYLKIKGKTAYALVGQGKIPSFKVGGSWRFNRSEIDEWIEQQASEAINKSSQKNTGK